MSRSNRNQATKFKSKTGEIQTDRWNWELGMEWLKGESIEGYMHAITRSDGKK